MITFLLDYTTTFIRRAWISRHWSNVFLLKSKGIHTYTWTRIFMQLIRTSLRWLTAYCDAKKRCSFTDESIIRRVQHHRPLFNSFDCFLRDRLPIFNRFLRYFTRSIKINISAFHSKFYWIYTRIHSMIPLDISSLLDGNRVRACVAYVIHR